MGLVPFQSKQRGTAGEQCGETQGSVSISGGVGGNEVSEVSSVPSLIFHHLPP